MPDRPTKTLNTPEQKELVIKEYLTARESNELKGIYLRAMKLNANADGKAQINDLSGDIINQAEEKLLELAIVSYDGKSGREAVDTLLDGHPKEYKFVLEQVGGLENNFLAETSSATPGNNTSA